MMRGRSVHQPCVSCAQGSFHAVVGVARMEEGSNHQQPYAL
jgi:hypothetical protein